MAALGWAEYKVSVILQKYAEKLSENIGEDSEVMFGGTDRIWITGIDRGNCRQIAVDFTKGKH